MIQIEKFRFRIGFQFMARDWPKRGQARKDREEYRMMSARSEWRFNIVGWLLFTLSALAFTWTTLRFEDWVGFAASLLFLIACVVFLVPVWRKRPTSARPS